MGKWLDMLRDEKSPEFENHRQDGECVTGCKITNISPTTQKQVSEKSTESAMERVCIGLNILPSEFRALIEDDEAQHIATGRIPMKSARAYARLFAGELARDPYHPVNLGMNTCWSCDYFKGKRCALGCATILGRWFRCDSHTRKSE